MMDKSNYRESINNLIRAKKYANIYYETLLNEYKLMIASYKNVYLFGGGAIGRCAVDILADCLTEKNVVFIDNDPNKHGQILYAGISCYGTERLIGCNANDSIILLTNTSEALKDQLIGKESSIYATKSPWKERLGKTYIASDFGRLIYCYTYPHHDEYDLVKYEKEILSTFDLYSDESSMNLFYRKLLRDHSTITNFNDYMTLPQYFPEEIKQRLSADEIFLDCGAYLGDSIEEFQHQTDNQYKRIIAFEMDDSIRTQLMGKPFVKDQRITIIPAGVSDRNRSVKYSKDQCPSYVIQVDEAKNFAYAELKSIDSLIADGSIPTPITFVKMDIEGAELDALHGMEKVLRNDKPKLAICVYHQPKDLWEIPLYIKGIVPEYLFLLRHHSDTNLETVLYAFLP